MRVDKTVDARSVSAVEIQQLRHLIAAVETDNLVAAAEQCHISQSGLSRSIKTLENRLGVPLLIRSQKGVEPTIYGLSVLRRAQIFVNELEKSIDEIRAIEQARVGEVKVGITQNYSSYLVPQLIKNIRKKRPGVRFSVVADGFFELLDMLKTERIDFAFGLIGPIQESDGIVIEPLRAHRSRVLCGRHHLLARSGFASLDDLRTAQWAMLNSEGVQRGFSLFFESKGLKVPAQIVRTNNIDLLRHLIDEGDLLTVLPAEVVATEITSGEILEIECDAPVGHTRVGLLYREGALLTPQAELVIDKFRQVSREHSSV